MSLNLSKEEKTEFKRTVKNDVVAILLERVRNLSAAINSAGESANSEDKSSAGDKYEVGRAMGHLQQEMLSEQLEKAIHELALVNSLNTETLCNAVTTGAVVVCGELTLFIACGLGNVTIANQKVTILSPKAPLALSIMNKATGYSFVFNNKSLKIEDIF